eukprot:947218-Alexandrium_andersonii.AAC.1
MDCRGRGRLRWHCTSNVGTQKADAAATENAEAAAAVISPLQGERGGPASRRQKEPHGQREPPCPVRHATAAT